MSSDAIAPAKTEKQATPEIAAAGQHEERKEEIQQDATPTVNVTEDKVSEVKTHDQTAAPVTAEAASEVVKTDEVKTNAVTTEKKDSHGNKNGKFEGKNRINNCKFDASQMPDSDNPEEIRHQVEFYFGDQNLPLDKFLWEQTGGFENKPVSLSTIHSFKRMQRFKPYSAVVAALRDSKFLVVEGDDGKETIRRTKAYQSSKNVLTRTPRSVYVKGFGDEEPTTQFKLEAWFLQFGPLEAVRLRRTDDNTFKGSVFTEFKAEESAKAFLALDPKPTYEGKELQIMSKKAYVDMKGQLIKEGKMQPSKSSRKMFWEGTLKGPSHQRGAGKHMDKDNWKERRDHDQKSGHHKHGQRGRGRGRGRGGQRGGNRGRRDRDDEAPQDVAAQEIREVEAAAKADGAAASQSHEKRPRDEEAAAGGDDAPAAKKVDTKPDLIAAKA